MQQNQTQLYLYKIHIPEFNSSSQVMNKLLNDLLACCSINASNNNITNQATINLTNTVIEQSKNNELSKKQMINTIFTNLFKAQDMQIQDINNFAILLGLEKENGVKFTNQFINVMDKLSILILKSLKKHLHNPTQIVLQMINNLLQGISKQQFVLKGEMTYKLFICLIEFYTDSILHQPLPKITQFFNKFVQYFVLIENQIIAKQEIFVVMRKLLKYFSIVLAIINQKTVPKDFNLYLRRLQVQFIQNQSLIVIEPIVEEQFFITLEKYVLVDPQYRNILLKTIELICQYVNIQLIQKFTTSRIMKIYTIVINLVNKQIFKDYNYDEHLFTQLIKIKNGILKQDQSNFNQMILILIDKKDRDFFMNYKSFLIKLATNEQIQIKLFSFYYDQTFSNKQCDLQILNALVQWNVGLKIVPPEKFINDLLQKGLNKLTYETQSIIASSQGQAWNNLMLRIVEHKCKQFIQDKNKLQSLLNYDCFRDKPQIYLIQMKMFAQLITNIQADKFQESQISFIVLTQNMEIIRKIKEHVSIITKKALENKVKGFSFFKYFSLVSSFLQILQPANLQNEKLIGFYVDNIQSLNSKQLAILVEFLLRTFIICKNTLSLFLIICCGIKIYTQYKNQDSLKQTFIKNIERIIKIHQTEGYAKITSYHCQNLKALLFLTNVSQSQYLKHKCQQLISSWSSIYNRFDLQLIFYQFDVKIYKFYLQKFKVKLQPTNDIQKSIFTTLSQILQLLKQPHVKNCLYLHNSANCINFIPIRHENHKNSLYLQFKVLINSKLSCHSALQIYGTPRDVTQNQQKHRLIFRHKKISFWNRSTKQNLGTLQLEQQHYAKPFTISIHIANSKIQIKVNQTQLITQAYNYLVDTIKFDLQGDIMLRQLKWKRFEQEQKKLSFKQLFQIYPSEAEIKISKVFHYQIKNIQQKFSIFYICTYLQEILKVNKQILDLNKFYQLCCQIIFKKQGNPKQQLNPSQFSCLRKLFNSIIIANQGKQNKIEIPEKALQNINLNSKKCYPFLISSVISEKFLFQCSEQSRSKLYNYLNQLLFSKKSDFRLAVQNRKLRIFTNIIKSISVMQTKNRQKYSQLIKKLILTHEANQILLKKLSFFFYFFYGAKCKYLQNLFENLLEKIFFVLHHNQNQQNYHVKIIGKYILSAHKNLELIFLVSSINIKTKILDNMIQDDQLSANCHRLFQQLHPNQLLELSGWLIVYGKKNMFQFFQHKKQSLFNLYNLIFFMNQLTQLYPIETDQNHCEEILVILNNFIKKTLKLLNEKIPYEVSENLQKFFWNPNFIKLIAQKLNQNRGRQIKDQFIQNFLNDYFNGIFKIMPKYVTLKALQQFRKLKQFSFDCCIYMVNYEQTLMLPERNLSAFLQYLIQVLFQLRYEQESTSRLKQLAKQISHYVQKITKNYSKQNKISQINQPFLYSFPKMQKRLNFSDKKIIKKLIKNVQQSSVYELKGGICFKTMCIIFHLIQILPEYDHTDLLIFCVDKMGQKNKIKNNAAYRAISDFAQVSKQTKNRSSIQPIIEEHQKYFQKLDEEIAEISSPISIRRSSSKINIDTDLTPFFIDFFFMKIFLFLENHCKKPIDPNQQQIFEKYSKNTFKFLKQFQLILEQMNQKNTQSTIKYYQVSDLLDLMDKQEELTISQQIFSPNFSNFQIKKIESQENHIDFFKLDKGQVDAFFLQGTPTPQSPRISRRVSMNTQNNNNTAKKLRKKQLLNKIQNNIQCWSQEGKQKQIHRYFRQQTKQIFFNQLVHQFFIITSSSLSQRVDNAPKGKRLIRFFQDIGYQFNEHDKNNDESWKNVIQQIKKVKLFTCIDAPQIQHVLKSFPNLTFPFVQITVKPETKQNIIKKEINESFVLNLRDRQIQQNNSPDLHLNTVVCLQDEQINQKFDKLCQILTINGSFFCQWQFQNTSIIFTSKGKKQTNKQSQRILKYGTPSIDILCKQNYKMTIEVSNIFQIFCRKYNQSKYNSLQFFFKNGKSIYIILYTQEMMKNFLNKCKKRFPQFRFIKIVDNFNKAFQNQGFTQKWLIGQISNFDYLMLINKYVGRTNCDLNQYYIFPWVIEDFTSKNLDICDQKIYRDLKKPIGALNPQKFSKYQQKLSCLDYFPNEKYLYGSFYSTSLFIVYYMVRLQPFTYLHKDFQSGIFDNADRLFSSIQQMWECLMNQSSTSDIKESIPQFYYFPTFLKNINNLDLGVKQSGKILGDVQLPPWASNPTDFVLKMRACLQSDYVSSNLNYWIDLVFGKDQKSFQKQNVFYPLVYIDNINLEKIPFQQLDKLTNQVTLYGHCPHQLFSREHPKKKLKIYSINVNKSSLLSSQQFLTKQTSNKNSTLHCQQQNLQYIHYVSSMQFQCKNLINLKISGISKNSPVKSINLQMQNTTHSLIRAIQKPQSINVKRLLSQNNIQVPQQKIISSSKINNNQFQISIGVKQNQQVVKKIKLSYSFKGIKYNQIVFVIYGHAGLKVYNWNQQLIWQFTNQNGQITDCFLSLDIIFFTTSNGKLFIYDFFGNFSQQVYSYQKPTYTVDMLVYQQRKYVTKRNENSYKIILVGDKRKIRLIHYTHQIGKFQAKIE